VYRGRPDRLGAFLLPSLRGTAFESGYRQWLALEAWPSVAGEKAAAHSRAASLHMGVYTVHVATNLWAVELSYRKEAFLRRLRELFEGVEIAEVRFVVRRLEPPDEAGGEPDADDLEAYLEELSPEDEAVIDEEAACLQDASLRAVARKAMAADFRYRRAREKMGWKPCARCGVVIPSGDLCTFCAREASPARAESLARLLAAMPWLSWEDCASLDPELTREEYINCYETLMSDLSGRLQEISTRAPKDQPLEREDRTICTAYCMLKSGEPPHVLNEDSIKRHLGDGLFALFSMAKEDP